MPRRPGLPDANLALDGKLVVWLRGWDGIDPSGAEMTRRINDALTEKAERLGAPIPDPYAATTIYRWAVALEEDYQ